MVERLSVWEFRVHLVTLTSVVAYCFVRVFLDEAEVSFVESDFEGGWGWLGRRRDVSNFPWVSTLRYGGECGPWILVHLVGGSLVRKYFAECVPVFYFSVNVVFHLLYFPVYVPLVHGVLFVGSWLVMYLGRSVRGVWLFGVFVLYVVNEPGPWLVLDDYSAYVLYVGICWTILRCIDASVESLQSGFMEDPVEEFVLCLGYCFYLPTFWLGPFIPYKDFKEALSKEYEPWSYARIITLLKAIVRYGFWLLVLETSRHFLYCEAMTLEMEQVIATSGWTIAGVGFCVSYFFFLHYVITYGMCGSVARAELVPAPPHPKCVFRIHMYSRMWRYFDRGYYTFVFTRIYSPLCGGPRAPLHRKLLSSIVCFFFIWIWHGVSYSVFLWSLFNFIGISMEGFGASLLHREWMTRLKAKVGAANFLRLCSLVAAPFWLLALLSNLIFFGGYDFGLVYFKQLCSASLSAWAVVALVGYSICVVSRELELRELHQTRKTS